MILPLSAEELLRDLRKLVQTVTRILEKYEQKMDSERHI